MTTSRRASPSTCQRGAATLFMTLMLLLIAGLVLLYTSRSAITEQRLSANEIRAKQAFAAANAGLDNALAYMQDKNGIDHDGNGVPDTVSNQPLVHAANAGGSGVSSYYAFRYCQTNATASCPTAHGAGVLPTCTPNSAPTDFKDVMAVACGWSDDDTAVHLVSQRIGGTPSLPGTIPVPLISRGAAGLTTGGATVFNYFSDLTVWSGDAMTNLSSNAKTYVRDTANPKYATADTSIDTDGDKTPDYRDVDKGTATCDAVPGYTCASHDGKLGHDTVTGDPALKQGTGDDFFQLFFGDSPSNYEKSVAWKVDTNNTITNENSTDVNSIKGISDQSIWVTAGTGANALTIPSNSTIGSPDHPVILIVDGELSLSGSFDLYGVIYVRGDLTGSASPNIYGSMIVQGNVDIKGSPNIIFDPYGGSSLTHDGIATKLPGSWKDW